MSGRRPPKSSRTASFFLLLGCSTILGVTFATGVIAGRHWPQLLPALGGAPAARAAKATARFGSPPEAVERPRASEPALTFYQELTAPLTAPPPAPPPAAPRKAADKTIKPAEKAAERAPERVPGEGRFTVQVGAFRTREQADAFRTKLAGEDAYIAELEGTPGARYRVRVGSFSTRDEARQAAQRITSGGRLSTFVTTR